MNWQDKEYHEQSREVPSWQRPARTQGRPATRPATPTNAGTIAALAIIAFVVILLTR